MGSTPARLAALPPERPQARTVQDLALLLRQLRRRHARARGDTPLTYRELAATTGWALGVISDYFTGKVLPPTDRFDVLVGLLGAAPAEQGMLATLRDEVEEHQRRLAADQSLNTRSVRGDAGVVADDRNLASANAVSPEAVPSEQNPADHPGPDTGHSVGTGEPHRRAPQQVPRLGSELVGREEHLATLDAVARETLQGIAPGLCLVSGTAGIGKTALALHWAHRSESRFPDGQLYADLRGYDPAGVAVPPEEVLAGFLVALRVPRQEIPEGVEARSALLRSELRGRRVLLVLDNALDAEQVRPLLPGVAGCLVVVTSRSRLTSLVSGHGGVPITLDLLSRPEARRLLAARLGEQRTTAEPPAVEEIIARCSRLPLALAVVAAQAAIRPDFPLSAVATALRDEHGLLDTLGGPDAAADLRSVFSWSVSQLGASAARLFRLLGLHAGPGVGAWAAAALSGVPLRRARADLAELSHAHLLVEQAPGWYVLHDLLRAYARELVDEREPGPERTAARDRLWDHYVRTACTADRLLYPYRDPIQLDEPSEASVTEPLAGYAEALTWFNRHHRVLAAIAEEMALEGSDRITWQLVWGVTSFLEWRGYGHDHDRLQSIALHAARRLGDPASLATTHLALGRGDVFRGRHAEAIAWVAKASALFATAENPVGQARAQICLGAVADRQGHHQEALDHVHRALALFREAGHAAGEATALNNIGWLSAQLGEYETALDFCQQSLAVRERLLDDPQGQATSWDSLGYTHHLLGDTAEAIRCYERALELCRAVGDRAYEADILQHLGDSHHEQGEDEQARATYREALELFEELGYPGAVQVRAKLAAFAPRAEVGAPGTQQDSA